MADGRNGNQALIVLALMRPGSSIFEISARENIRIDQTIAFPYMRHKQLALLNAEATTFASRKSRILPDIVGANHEFKKIKPRHWITQKEHREKRNVPN